MPDLIIPSNIKVNGTATTINAFGRDGGADYIERNAFLLVKLIQQVNATLAANRIIEKLVVVGPSMGGQISRYALAYMEKQQSLGVANMNHNCRLWVSFDSPHSGANVPMTVQETLRFFGTEGGQKDAQDNYQNQLRSPAARQLLIEQLDGQNSTENYHSTYYTNLKNNGLSGSNGYPMNLRKVTLVNGTGSGTQTYGDYTEVLNGVGRKTFLNLKVFELVENFMPSYNQNKRITLERVTIPRFLILPSITFITKRYNVTNINPRGSMDAVAGSTTSTINDVYTQFSQGLTDQKVRQSWSPLNTTVNPPVPAYPNHCFIPTISALGFKNSSFNWNTPVNNRNLLCNNEINFDNYYIPTVNQPHIYLNTDNINWLTQELNKGQPGCPKICSFAIIGGSDPLCTTANTTYNLDVNIPAGATTQWSTSPSLQIVSYTPNSITVREVSNPTFSTITATIVNPCGANAVITRTIQTGPPTITNIAYFMSGNCSGGYQSWNLSATANTTVNSWRWTIDNPANSSWYISSSNSPTTFVDVTNGTGGGITISATNGCGTGKNGVTIYSNCAHKIAFTASPNPTSNSLIVSMLPDQNKSLKTTNNSNNNQGKIYQIKVVDQIGNIRKQYKYNGVKDATINLQDLNSGAYLLQVFNGTVWESITVLKK